MINIVPREPNRYQDYLAVWNAVWPEYAATVEELEHADTLDEELRANFWLAECNGVVCGILEVGPITGSHEPGRFTVNIAVPEGSRRQGVGRSLFEFAEQSIAGSKPLAVITYVHESDEDSIGFATRRNFKEDKRDFYSVLELKAVEPTLIDELVSEAPSRGIEIVSGVKADGPDFRRAMHDLFEEVRKDIPRSFPPTPLTHDQFNSAFIGPEFCWDCSMFAMQGSKMVGLSTCFKGPVQGHLVQGLTAVSREHRGVALAKRLKARLIQAAILQGYESIGTDNDTRNAPMIAINDQFGFKRQPGVITFLWKANGS